MEVLDADTVRLFGPPTLFAEVLEKIPVVAADRGADESIMLEHWQYFRSRIQLELPDPILTEAFSRELSPAESHREHVVECAPCSSSGSELAARYMACAFFERSEKGWNFPQSFRKRGVPTLAGACSHGRFAHANPGFVS